jgi:ribosomal protein L11 methyltransferase
MDRALRLPSQPPTLRVGRRIRIVPPGATAGEEGGAVVMLERGAFGSGEHETTRSCLEELERLAPLRGARVLDLGSGTGVLAIAALKLGAARAVCVDVDARAVATARRNAQLNGLGDRIAHHLGTLADADPGPYDLVVANLYADVLLPVAGTLVPRVRAGGALLLSGVDWEHAWEVRRRYEELGCSPLRVRMLEEYCTLVLGAGGEAEG